MKEFLENPNLLIKEINEMALISQRKAFITVGIEIQKNEIETISDYRNDLLKLKSKFVEIGLEKEANLVYCFEKHLLAIEYELQMLVNIKEDKMSDAWGNLVNAQLTFAIVVRNYPYDLESSNSYLERLENYENLLFPKMLFASVGGIIINSHCSICNTLYNQCDHIKGKLYNGELCTRVITKSILEEVSIVDIPANKHCRILSTSINGKSIDTLTLREILSS